MRRAARTTPRRYATGEGNGGNSGGSSSISKLALRETPRRLNCQARTLLRLPTAAAKNDFGPQVGANRERERADERLVKSKLTDWIRARPAPLLPRALPPRSIALPSSGYRGHGALH